MNIKKRIVLGAAVGTTVFGSVFGLAAGLTVTSGEQLGSGAATVTSCDSSVSTTYEIDGNTGMITAVNLVGLDADCDQAIAHVALYTGDLGTVLVATESDEIVTQAGNNNSSDSVAFSPQINAAAVTRVLVTLEGGEANGI